MAIYWSDAEKKDQEARSRVKAGRVYTEDARCDWCGDRLNGYAFECEECQALMCPLHSCVDGRCPEHTRAGGGAVKA